MTLAPFDLDTFHALEDKHPQMELPECPLNIPQEVLDPQRPPFPISVRSVTAAIASFPPGSAAGLDMLKPQHLKDLTGHTAGAAGTRLLEALVNLCAVMLRGEVPEEVCPFLYGASMCALNKKEGGIRPIAVGNTFRRLAAKLGVSFVNSRLGEYFRPTQFGFGTKGGAEAVSHAARNFIDFPHVSPKVFVKLDFKNAFNTVRRQVFLDEAAKHIPELSPFLSQCYGQVSHLTFGPHVLTSSCGIQQGDPLGPALFCLAVQPLAESLTTEVNFWYLDDVSLGGTADSVLQNLNSVVSKSAEMGLELNIAKCEVFLVNGDDLSTGGIMTAFTGEAPGILFPEAEDFTLLGAPLTREALSKVMDQKISDLELVSDRLVHLSSHYAFYVLKHCLAIPKLMYTLRCSPTWRVQSCLDKFDSTLLTTLEKIININLTPLAREQSMLPVAEGGLGLRQATSSSVPAFLASVYSTMDLVRTMLPAEVRSTTDACLEEALGGWGILTGQSPPPPDNRANQHHWEKILFERIGKDVQLRATNLTDKARLLGVASKASGAFLNAVPSPSLGTFLQDPSFRIAVSLRLGAQICQPHQCHCGVMVDRMGLHGLNCKQNSGRAARHAMANDVIRRGLGSAGYPVSMEPAFISPDTNKRPDGITLSPWERGKSLAWDFTCVNSQAESYLAGSAGIPLHAATNAETKKKEKYAFLGNTCHFAPIAAECLGSLGHESMKTIKSIGRKIGQLTGESKACEFFIQRLSIAIQKGNALAILETIPRGVSMDEEVFSI